MESSCPTYTDAQSVDTELNFAKKNIDSNKFPNILETDNFIPKKHIEELKLRCNRRTNDNLQLFKKECKNKLNCLLVLEDGNGETLNYLQTHVQNIANLGYTPLDHSQEISHVNFQCLNFKNYDVVENLDICGIFLFEISLSKQLEHIIKTKCFHSLILNAIKELSKESSGCLDMDPDIQGRIENKSTA
ncbi:4087_t:CDS:2, partial [Gigaspora margarita]